MATPAPVRWWQSQVCGVPLAPLRPSPPVVTPMPHPNTPSNAPPADAVWDAGDLGCGEILILLRGRMEALAPGQVLRLTARDRAAPEEMPAWCRLTRRTLLYAEHPLYWIEQRQLST